MKYRERTITQKTIGHAITQLRKKCPACGKLNGSHKSKEAKVCQKRMNEPWFYSVEQERTKESMKDI